MMMQDAPRQVKKSADDLADDVSDEDAMNAEIEAMTQYYQSVF
ncbi:MAG: hypothetical protein SNH27_11520 [Rikenellaceae bacterium]